jgi:hypothetical protein
MDMHSQVWYANGHETLGESGTIGAETPGSDRILAGRPHLPEGRKPCAFVGGFSSALVSGVPPQWPEGVEAEADTGAPASVDCGPSDQVGAAAFSGGREGRLQHRVVDAEADRRADRKSVWRSLPTAERSSDPFATAAMELAKAGTKSGPARRAGDRPMETNGLAGYKEKPGGGGPTWSSSTEADFWSSPASERRGLPSVGHRYSDIVTVTTESPPFRHSRSRL